MLQHAIEAESPEAARSLSRIFEQTGGEIVDGTVGTFTSERHYDEKRSAEIGEPYFVQHDYCIIRVPGRAAAPQKQLVRKVFPAYGEVPERKVQVETYHCEKYPRAWDAFLRGEDLRPEGTPLENCDRIPRERVPELRAKAVRTVEELANLPDASLDRIGKDGRVMQRLAREYLDEHDELAALRKRVAELEQAAKPAEGVTDATDDLDDTEQRRGRRRNRAAS